MLEMLLQPNDNEDEIGCNSIVDNNASMEEITHVDRKDNYKKTKKKSRNDNKNRKIQDRSYREKKED